MKMRNERKNWKKNHERKENAKMYKKHKNSQKKCSIT